MRANIFSDGEEKTYMKWRLWRDKVLEPVLAKLSALGIKANWVTYASFLMVFPFIYFFKFNPWIAFIFIVLNVIFDGIDGSLARYKGASSDQNGLMDTVFDNLSFLVFFMTVFYYGVFSPFWGALYISNYIVLLFLIAIARNLKIKVFPVIRSRYYFFLFLLIFLLTGWNFFDYFLVMLSVYMAITNVFLFQRIKCTF
ncbi:CDP-alcohol phosphatidyltransferase family protein [Candidatus Gracilibacteria bacterium]|nr:CDP-alcohol phosphatidyltransferase family protein [Candidatus Gracilibacteria bacterium]